MSMIKNKYFNFYSNFNKFIISAKLQNFPVLFKCVPQCAFSVSLGVFAVPAVVLKGYLSERIM